MTSPGAVLTRRHLEIALGALWLLDGALQFQPYNFTPGFFAGILGMANMGLPGAVSTADYHVALILTAHPPVWNAVFASIQVVLGAGLLWPRTARWAGAASVPWALGVWIVGEGFGGVFMGGTSLLTGAPGAALLYAVIAVLVRPSSRSGPGRVTLSRKGSPVSRTPSCISFPARPPSRRGPGRSRPTSRRGDG